jgi:hypothetical protein
VLGRLTSILAAVAIAALGFATLPVAAEGTLAYVRYTKPEGPRWPERPYFVIAHDDGSGAHRVAFGSSPHVSPNGQLVVFIKQPLFLPMARSGHAPAWLELASVSGEEPLRVMNDWRLPDLFAWSPDSSTIAALRGPEIGKQNLVLTELASGAQRTVASGFFNGFSFSPDGTELVFGRATSERFPPRTDIFRVPVTGGRPVQITHDHRSEDPLWGPAGRVVFVKLLGARKRKFGPKNELYLMNSNGGQVHRLTHTKVDPLLQGLFPTEWSVDGSRLLAEFEGQDTSYAVAVDPRTGAQRPVGMTGEQGFVGTALSSDGTTVLGFTGGFEPGPHHRVATFPYGGGPPTILARNAFEPSWSR